MDGFSAKRREDTELFLKDAQELCSVFSTRPGAPVLVMTAGEATWATVDNGCPSGSDLTWVRSTGGKRLEVQSERVLPTTATVSECLRHAII